MAFRQLIKTKNAYLIKIIGFCFDRIHGHREPDGWESGTTAAQLVIQKQFKKDEWRPAEIKCRGFRLRSLDFHEIPCRRPALRPSAQRRRNLLVTHFRHFADLLNRLGDPKACSSPRGTPAGNQSKTPQTSPRRRPPPKQETRSPCIRASYLGVSGMSPNCGNLFDLRTSDTGSMLQARRIRSCELLYRLR